MTSFLALLHGAPRLALVTVALVPLLIIVLASVPALLVLPFLPDGTDRSLRLIRTLITWLRVTLEGSAGTARG
ncbi:hypothetical protein ACWFRF_30170 [Nocardia sp. NPDC055165]|uniref:hypothetical protein n=1 Tax=Nocardia sp. A7 TaxID=2789274 RepID=UPI00397E4D39